MNVVVRVDASVDIGTGHVMRCLALAERLRCHGMDSRFVCRTFPGDLCDLVTAHGFGVDRLPAAAAPAVAAAQPFHARWLGTSWQEDAAQTQAAIAALPAAPAWLLVDHYALDARWEAAMRPSAARIAVIDDLGDRAHDCDLLIDPGLGASRAAPAGEDGSPARILAGPRYAPLRGEFDVAPTRLRDRGLQQALIFFGGSDATNETLKLVEAWRLLGDGAPAATVVLGPANPYAESVHRAAAGLDRLVVIPPTREMARLMAAADLGIGACGGSALERCALGLPALVVITAENQRDEAARLDRLGALRLLGDAADVGAAEWAAAVTALRYDAAELTAMSAAAVAVMRDWQAAAAVVVSAFTERMHE